MHGPGDEAYREGRAGDFTVSGKWGVHLDAGFKVDLAIQIDRDVPAGSLDLSRAKRIPDGSAGIRYDSRKLVPACPKAHNRERPAVDDLFKLDFVFHGNSLDQDRSRGQ